MIVLVFVYIIVMRKLNEIKCDLFHIHGELMKILANRVEIWLQTIEWNFLNQFCVIFILNRKAFSTEFVAEKLKQCFWTHQIKSKKKSTLIHNYSFHSNLNFSIFIEILSFQHKFFVIIIRIFIYFRPLSKNSFKFDGNMLKICYFDMFLKCRLWTTNSNQYYYPSKGSKIIQNKIIPP